MPAFCWGGEEKDSAAGHGPLWCSLNAIELTWTLLDANWSNVVATIHFSTAVVPAIMIRESMMKHRFWYPSVANARWRCKQKLDFLPDPKLLFYIAKTVWRLQEPWFEVEFHKSCNSFLKAFEWRDSHLLDFDTPPQIQCRTRKGVQYHT